MGFEIQSQTLPRDPKGSKIYCRTSQWDLIGSWILQLVERSSGIIDPTLGSMDTSDFKVTFFFIVPRLPR